MCDFQFNKISLKMTGNPIIVTVQYEEFINTSFSLYTICYTVRISSIHFVNFILFVGGKI